MNDPAPCQQQHLPCPFCGQEAGDLLGVKAFCKNEDCVIFDLPIDAEKWNGRLRAADAA